MGVKVMAIDSLASVAHAAGFAMVPEDDVVTAEHKAGTEPTTVFTDGSGRWQGTTQPIHVTEQSARSGSIFDWVPNFNWRADGR